MATLPEPGIGPRIFGPLSGRADGCRAGPQTSQGFCPCSRGLRNPAPKGVRLLGTKRVKRALRLLEVHHLGVYRAELARILREHVIDWRLGRHAVAERLRDFVQRRHDGYPPTPRW